MNMPVTLQGRVDERSESAELQALQTCRRVPKTLVTTQRAVVAIVAGAALLIGVVGCLAIGGMALLFSRSEAEAAPAWRTPPAVPPVGPGSPPGSAVPDQAGQMRARYRPGPYVTVEGLLPSGRMRVSRMDAPGRSGRSVDTPWIVGGAELRPGAAPSPTAAGGPSLRSADAPASGELTVIAGVPARVALDADDGQGAGGDVSAFLVAFHGYPGHFFLPASVDTELGHVQVAGVDEATVYFGIDSPLRPDGRTIDAPLQVTMYVAAVDTAGRISPYVTRSLSVMPVGNGDVEVTLTMTAATDLDLYVIDPAGVTVYYGNTTSFSGGRLDLDANAACSGNLGVNNEHIYWPRGEAPAGTYTVRVANFESCIGGAPVDYRVTVTSCGEIAVLAGRFEGTGNTDTCDRPPGAARDWCQDVVEFEVEPCEGAPPAQ